MGVTKIGRPINKKYLGSPSAANRTYPALMMSSAWMLGQTAISTVPVYIVKQIGAFTYYCSDGTNFGSVMLQGSAPTAPGQGTIIVTPYSPTAEGGATFTFTYKVSSATLVSGGAGYYAGNTITFQGGAVITVNTVVNFGTIATFTLTTPGSSASVTPSNATGASGTTGIGTGSAATGTSATFNLNWIVNSASASGGVNYTAGEALQLVGITATTIPQVTIASVSSTGAPIGCTIVNAGSGITQSPTSITGSNPPPTYYASKITNRVVSTFSDQDYTWNCFVAASAVGQANLPFSGTGSEQTTYMSGSELQDIGGSPYFSANYGSITAKQGQIFATGGITGGLGSQSQPAADVGGLTGIYNPSATQRKAPTETRSMRMARLAKERAEREKNDLKESKQSAEDNNKVAVNTTTATSKDKSKTSVKQQTEVKKVDSKTKVEEKTSSDDKIKDETKSSKSFEESSESPLAELAKKEEHIQENHEEVKEERKD